jgi:hypothetical protein
MPIAIFMIGIFGNTSAFLIFRFNKDMRKISSMVYLSFAAMTDTISLFGFNLNNFLNLNLGISMLNSNIVLCRLVMFFQFTTLQSSGLLISMLSVDRFFSIIAMPGSLASKLPFNSVKSACIWSIGIIVSICCLNSHILILAGVYESSFSNSSNSSRTFFRCYKSWTMSDIYPKWNIVNMTLYNLLPFAIMIIFNALLIRYGIFKNKGSKTTSNSGHARKKELTITLLLVTFLYILMVLPGGIYFGFYRSPFFEIDQILILVFDALSFLNRSSLFFACLITNLKFRSIVLDKFEKRFSILKLCVFCRNFKIIRKRFTISKTSETEDKFSKI